MDQLNIIDIIAAVMAVGALALGHHRGFVAQLVSIAGLFVALLAAYWLYDDVAPAIAAFLPVDRFESYDQYAYWVEGLKMDVYVYNAVAFALIFFAVKIGLTIVGRLLHVIVQIPGLKTLNKWSGAVLALLEAAVLFAVAVQVMSVMPSDSLQRTLEGSVSAGYVMQHTPELTSLLVQWWNKENAN